MAEVKNNEEESTLPAKRKPDPDSVEKKDEPKKQKSEICDEGASFTAEEDKVDEGNGDKEDEEDFEDDEDEDEDDEDEDDDEDDEHSNGKAEIDRKGKGIMRDDKGKGKMVEEDDSDDDDSSDGEALSDYDSDLSDDPLAEVDLDNILPSRTRRRVINPGVYIASDVAGDNDDSDSDDSDA